MRAMMKRWLGSPWAHAPIGAVILLAPALINGFPFYFYDTLGYHTLGQSIVDNIRDILNSSPPVETADIGSAAQSAEDDNISLNYVGGRAPLYGLLLYFSAALGTYWFTAIAQAALASWLISSALRALRLVEPEAFFLAIAVATLFSTLPYFTADLMPDVFTGFAFILTLILFIAPERFSLIERLGFIAFLAFSIEVHQTNLPITLLLILICVGVGWRIGLNHKVLMQRFALTITPVILAMSFNVAYAQAVALAVGRAPSSPPYLMARVLADGPGRLYLRDACVPEPRFEICRYADRPLNEVNDILWSSDPRVGVLQFASADARKKLGQEELGFVLGVITHYPVQQLASSVSHAFALMPATIMAPQVHLSRNSWEGQWLASVAPRRDNASASASLAFRGDFPISVVDIINTAALWLAAVYLLWRLTGADVRAALASPERDEEANIRRALAFIAAALLIWLAANAFVCGAFSGVFHRYQARTIWLVPLLAAVVALRIGVMRQSLARTVTRSL